jgi:hypothetical protein
MRQVKFIKFFAWEEQWIQRALDAREIEMKWMIKGMALFFLVFDVICFIYLIYGWLRIARMNQVMFSLIWVSSPILVAVLSFFVYVVQGKELSVSIAFTVRFFTWCQLRGAVVLMVGEVNHAFQYA